MEPEKIDTCNTLAGLELRLAATAGAYLTRGYEIAAASQGTTDPAAGLLLAETAAELMGAACKAAETLALRKQQRLPDETLREILSKIIGVDVALAQVAALAGGPIAAARAQLDEAARMLRSLRANNKEAPR